MQAIIEARQVDYNTRRPHNSLEHLTPSEFVSQCHDGKDAEDVLYLVKSCRKTESTVMVHASSESNCFVYEHFFRAFLSDMQF